MVPLFILTWAGAKDSFEILSKFFPQLFSRFPIPGQGVEKRTLSTSGTYRPKPAIHKCFQLVVSTMRT